MLGIRKNFTSEGAEMPWHRLPRKVRKSPSVEVFGKHADVALRDKAQGAGGGGLMVRLDGLRGLFQPL